jgi:hypothetical protein
MIYQIILILGLSINTEKIDRVRAYPGNDIMADVQSHLPEKHPYNVLASDYGMNFVDPDSLKISTVHECVHGINSRIRNTYTSKHGVRYNGFYCFDDKYIAFEESKLNITDVLNSIPMSLRLSMYDATVKIGNKDWKDTPSYLTDEFIAHTSGLMYRTQKKLKIRDECPKFSLEMGIYNLYLLQKMKEIKYEDYDRFESFILWNFDRVFSCYNDEQGFKEIITILMNDDSCKDLRGFIIDELGTDFYLKLDKYNVKNEKKR